MYSAFTTLELMADPEYDPDLNKPWWELAWNAVVNWLISVVQWYNNIDREIKIGIGLTLFALACIITAITGGIGGGAVAALKAVGDLMLSFIVGVVSAVATSALIAWVTGESITDAMMSGLAESILWGGVFAFVSASVNAVKILRIRAKVKRAAQEYMRLQNTLADSAEDLINNKFVTATYDAKNKTFQYGVNSGLKKSGEALNAELAKLAPRLSCAETQAINRALNSGSKLKNLYLYTVNTSGKAAYACKVCTRAYGNTVAIIFSGLYK